MDLDTKSGKKNSYTSLDINHFYESITSKSKLKDDKTFLHKNSILIQSDVLNKNNFEKEIFDLIITSPPYNVDIKYNSHKDDLTYEEYLDFSEKWMKNCFIWTKSQGRFCLNIPLDKNKGGQKSVGADLTLLAQKIGWKYHSTIIWNEGNISRRTAWGSWLSAAAPYVIAPVELIVIFYKDEWKKTYGSKISDISKDEFMEWTNGLWTFNGESKKRIGHPAPFPIELPYRCIKLFSFVDDIIFDPFAGSGTTLIAANNNNRFSIGLEIDQKYFELAKQRIINETTLLL
ncbi:DNA-methyltransferase [Stygiobacter electus]|jgi:site-specific DNA-methyltransferase (adenine-specific)|uniref:Methyltransferase n=1 Tax=Stygiobacter electus TaxID=3032292 RepID=A0AAE3TEC8_9BACT|nr:site-specific DNA-methyltransferase [Stygiobacter electus]MDF1612138.1 site-specific DNA-methyltransferase [Stygiobacter electus]